MSKSRSLSSSGASWFHRKVKLQTLLGNCGDDEEEGIALDRVLHGQTAVGKTQKTVEIDNARFSDKDLTSFGPLAEAQFGTIELVSCRFDDRLYVRKRVSKKFALRHREQCSPKFERHILLQALKSLSRSSSMWTPHMLCAYQCESFLNVVMEYASGGSLWDILESSEGRLSDHDLEWWAPQCVSAIDWVHSRVGFVHRDIKPHNFVVRPGPSPRLLLIDFGSAAPLLKPDDDGVQRVQRSHCLVPCGTCDYISPEILQAHEEALVALEMSDNKREDVVDSDDDVPIRNRSGKKILQGDLGYGRETDWWSLGAMLYELAFGIAPFFASDIRQTYARIMNHESNLRFDRKEHVSQSFVGLIKGLLTHHDARLGRKSNGEIKNHDYFTGVDWSGLHSRPPPPNLLLPEFSYATPLTPAELDDGNSETSDTSKPFAFSALFQSSISEKPEASSLHHDPTSTPAFGRQSLSRGGSGGSSQKSLSAFIGFSWGPPKDAFDDATRIVPAEPVSAEPGLCAPASDVVGHALGQYPPTTPKRPSQSMVPPSTVRVTSVRRSVQSRPVSDREAMRVLVNCVGQSARKRVLESGKKPKVLFPLSGFDPLPPMLSASLSFDKGRPRAPSLSRLSPKPSGANGVRKELRFDDTAQMMSNLSYTNTFTTTLSTSVMSGGPIPFIPPPYTASDSGTMSELDGPPSPSPSPRPGSAMSMLSMSKRSVTPTISSGFLTATGFLARSSSVPPEGGPRARTGSLGSLNPNVPESGGKELGAQPRRARFADLDSPPSSPKGKSKERLLSTPHPKASGSNTERKGKEPIAQSAEFVDLSDSLPLAEPFEAGLRIRGSSTPHFKAGKNKVTARAHFPESQPSTPEPTREKVEKARAQSTPHPKGKENAARRGSKPPLQTRAMGRMTSTPARPSARRSTVSLSPPGFFSEDDDTIRPQPPRVNQIAPPMEENAESVENDGYLSDNPDNSLFTRDRCRNPSPPTLDDDDEIGLSTFDGDDRSRGQVSIYDDDEPDMFGVMEQRFKNLVADIANLSLHVDEFSSHVSNAR